MPSPTGRPPEKRARHYDSGVINDHSSFGIGASPVRRDLIETRPIDPGCVGCVGCSGCGSSQAKKVS